MTPMTLIMLPLTLIMFTLVKQDIVLHFLEPLWLILLGNCSFYKEKWWGDDQFCLSRQLLMLAGTDGVQQCSGTDKKKSYFPQ